MRSPRAWAAAWGALLVARAASAHIVPVPPSTCTLGPIDLSWRNTSAVVDPPAAGDLATIVYDLAAQTAHVLLPAPAPRGFVADAVPATLALSSFDAALVGGLDTTLAPGIVRSGDLVAPAVPLAISVSGATVVVSMALTTGIAGDGSRVVEGQPIDGMGLFSAVGVEEHPHLPPPFGDAPLAVRVDCLTAPRPDIDQFRDGTDARLLSAALTSRGLTLKSLVAPDPAVTPDFDGMPAAFRASAGDTTIAAGLLPDGLRRRGRRLYVGTSRDGRLAIGVRFLREAAGIDTWELAVKTRAPTPFAMVDPRRITLTTQAGGLIARMAAPFHARTNSHRLVFP